MKLGGQGLPPSFWTCLEAAVVTRSGTRAGSENYPDLCIGRDLLFILQLFLRPGSETSQQ